MLIKRNFVLLLILAAVSVALVLGTTACSLFKVEPAEAMDSTVEAMAVVESMSYSIDMEMEFNGVSSHMVGEGQMRMPADSRMTISTTVMGQEMEFEQITLGDKSYIKYPGSDKWGYMDLDIATLSSDLNSKPQDSLAYLESFGSVEQLIDGTVGGVECARYALVIDGNKLADVMLEQSKAQGVDINEPEATDMLRQMYAGAQIDVEVWVGKDDMLPRKEVIDMTLADGEGMGMHMSGTILFSDFDEPVTIEAPATSIPLEELVKEMVTAAGAGS